MKQNKFSLSRREAKRELGVVFDFADFPIIFVSGLLDDPEPALASIFYYGLLFFSKSICVNAQKKYGYATNNTATSHSLVKLCNEKDCYIAAIESLTRVEPTWDPELSVSCLEHKEAYKFVEAHYQTFLNNHPGLQHDESHSLTRQKASLPTSKLKEFYEPQNKKSPLNPAKKDFDYACLLAYIAIRSIVGRDSYKKITNLFILSRMDGRSSCVDSVEELSPKIQKYAKEYWMKRIKAELYDSWGVRFYGTNTRGCYYSLTMPIDQLVEEVEKKKKDSTRYKIQLKKYQDDIANARERLLGKKHATDARERLIKRAPRPIDERK